VQVDTQWGGLRAGQVMANAQPIFKKLEELEPQESNTESMKGSGKSVDHQFKQKSAPVTASIEL